MSEGSDPSVHFHSLLRLRRPATGVSGHESLSDSDESLFSPARGPPERGELSRDESAGEDACSDGDEGTLRDAEEVEARDREAAEAGDSTDAVVSMEEMVSRELSDDSMSEFARVYFVVLISSSSGVRNDTFFSAGKKRRRGAILRGRRCRAGLLARIEVRLWGCL